MPTRIETVTVHEVSHAVACMAAGHPPERIVIERVPHEGGTALSGYVTLPDDLPEDAAAVVGMAGGIGCLQIFGDDAEDADPSPSDCELVAAMHAYGNSRRINEWATSAAWRTVAENQTAIVALANLLLADDRLADADNRRGPGVLLDWSAVDIAAAVRSTPDLQKFSPVFDGIRFTRSTAMSSHAMSLQDLLPFAGRPIGMPPAHFQAYLRQRGGSR